MEQAKHYTCASCKTATPLGHRFCGRCGTPPPSSIANHEQAYYSELQTPGKAKLVVVRGDDFEGLSYQLSGSHHTLGSSPKHAQIAFEGDSFLDPNHADLYYENGSLFVKPEASVNGVFLRIKDEHPLSPGDTFLMGEQYFTVLKMDSMSDAPDDEGTLFSTSPKTNILFKLAHGTDPNLATMVLCVEKEEILLGREQCHLNFPFDQYASPVHCSLNEVGGQLFLRDKQSQNGTYLRITEPIQLAHGDYLFMGKKLFRIEMNTN